MSPWFARAALTSSGREASILLRLSPAESPYSAAPLQQPSNGDRAGIDLARMVACWPHAFVITDSSGRIEYANGAFLDMVQLGSESMVIGENLGRWLNRPGANFKSLLATIGATRVIRSAPTVLHSELGFETDVELAVAAIGTSASQRIGVMLIDVSRRILQPPDDAKSKFAPLNGSTGRQTLRQVTRSAVAMIEREYIRSALAAADNNRTATAESLGLSRQGLYAKLTRYGLLEEVPIRREVEGG
jgi:transcriptional regulator PpsR